MITLSKADSHAPSYWAVDWVESKVAGFSEIDLEESDAERRFAPHQECQHTR